MSSIAEEHYHAFKHVNAYVILKDGKRVATIAFHLSRSLVGPVGACVHWLGAPMVRGTAGALAADQHTLALKQAVNSDDFHQSLAASSEVVGANGDTMRDFALALDSLGSSTHWASSLREDGFEVLRAV